MPSHSLLITIIIIIVIIIIIRLTGASYLHVCTITFKSDLAQLWCFALMGLWST